MARQKIRTRIKFGLIVVVLVGFVSIALISVYPINCLIIGDDWCNFAQAQDLFQSEYTVSEAEQSHRIMFYCSYIKNGAKRDKCYYFAATIADEINMIAACDRVTNNWGKSPEECIKSHGYRAR